MRKLYLLSLALFAAACEQAPTVGAPGAAPGLTASARRAIPGQYIVTFTNAVADVGAAAQALGAKYGGTVQFIYTATIRGAALSVSDAAASAIASEPGVAAVEQDQLVPLDAEAAASSSGLGLVGAEASQIKTLAATHASLGTSGTQTNPVPDWGLQRIDQRALPLAGSYSYINNGAGVTVYIIDSGIDYNNTDFGGRAVLGVDETTKNGTGADCNGHGTKIAGFVGGGIYGVAKGVTLVSVKVLDCADSGTVSGVIAGVEWVTKQKARPAVANISSYSSFSSAYNQAVEASVAAGITYAVSGSGVPSSNACDYSPGSASNVLTVGATNIGDGYSLTSSYGPCIIIAAPGVNTVSDSIGSNTTSVGNNPGAAAAHVAGAAAIYLAEYPTATPAQVMAALVGNATAGVLSASNSTNTGGTGNPLPAGTPNLLLYTGGLAGLPAPPND